MALGAQRGDGAWASHRTGRGNHSFQPTGLLVTARPISFAVFLVSAGLLVWTTGDTFGGQPDLGSSDPGDAAVATMPTGPRWVWGPASPPAEPAATPAVTRFRGKVALVQRQGARLEVAAAGAFRIWFDGCLLGTGEGWERPTLFSLQGVASGEHLVAVEVQARGTVPALLVRTMEKPAYREGERVPMAHADGTDASWRWTTNRDQATGGWFEPGYDDTAWQTVQNGVSFDVAARLAWLKASAQYPSVAAALLQGTRELDHDERFALRDLDHAWLAEGVDVPEALVLAIYSALALDADERSLNHLHQVFETFPERRHLVAVGLARYAQAHRRRPADWRLLVRVVPIVQDDQAREIVAALLRFPERATRPRWLREMLLLGLKLGEDGGRDALAVLERWAGTTIYQPEDDWPTRVAAAQAWFAEKYPDQLPPHLPAEGVAARWRYEPLVALLKKSPPGDIQRGREVFAKARCHLCHRSDGQGETLGPDLTGLGNRLQLKEMVYATIFPSEWVSDQYTTYTVETTDGRIFTGLVGRQGNDKLVVLESSGNKQFLPQRAIERSVAQPLSIMPSDLLEPLSEQEVLDLFAFLRRRSSSDD